MGEELVRTDRAEAANKAQYLERVSHVAMGLIPKTIEDAVRFAELLSRSTIVPTDFRGNVSNCFVAIGMGAELGLGPLQSIQSIYVVNSKPALYGDGLLAVCISHPLCEWVDEPPVTDVATCTVKRKGWPNPITRTFSVDDAKKAGLWAKSGPWSTNPTRMLRMRARAFALRDAFADVLRGLASAEEMLDVVLQSSADANGGEVNKVEMLQTELGATDQQYAQILAAWDRLNVTTAGRLIQARKFNGNALGLLATLINASDVVATTTLAPPEPIPSAVTPLAKKRARARVKRTKAEGTAPAPTPEAQAESLVAALDPKAVCEHGVDVKVAAHECADCRRIALELDAEAAALESTVQADAPAETAQQYAARRKRELAELNSRPLPNVAPKDTNPL